MSQITFDQLASVFHLPMQKAAARLGVGITALKRACRRNYVLEWPYREITRYNRLIKQLNYEISVCEDEPTANRHRNNLHAIQAQLKSLMSAECMHFLFWGCHLFFDFLARVDG